MGLINRLKRITEQRIDAFLDGLEDPEAMYPLLLKELEDHAKKAGKAVVKAQGAVRNTQRNMDEAEGRRLRFHSGAKLALKMNDELTSRDALRAELLAEEDIEKAQVELSKAEEALHQSLSTAQQLNRQLNRLEEKKDEILNRAKLAEVQEEVNAAAKATGTQQNAVLDQVSKLAGKVKGFATRDEEVDDLEEGADLEARIRKLEREAEIERRLSAMRDQSGAS